jgi:hypothetical protein
MAIFLLMHLFQFRANRGAINTRTPEGFIGVIAGVWLDWESLHPLAVVLGLRFKVDLEWTS